MQVGPTSHCVFWITKAIRCQAEADLCTGDVCGVRYVKVEKSARSIRKRYALARRGGALLPVSELYGVVLLSGVDWDVRMA
jgi:hypothetical protein